MTDPVRNTDEAAQRHLVKVAQVMEGFTDTFRRSVALVQVGALDAASSWPEVAEGLDRMVKATDDEQSRQLLRRSARRTREMGRLARAIERDMARLLDT